MSMPRNSGPEIFCCLRYRQIAWVIARMCHSLKAPLNDEPRWPEVPKATRCADSLVPLLKKLARSPLVIVDDLGIASVPGKLYREFLEMLDDRQGQGATLITSQFPISQWHEIIADPTVADAILDRLVHNAYRIELKGESMRKGKTPPSENEI